MKINIGKHEFTECWDGVLYKALSDYPKVSDNEMKDILDFIAYKSLSSNVSSSESSRLRAELFSASLSGNMYWSTDTSNIVMSLINSLKLGN